MKIDIDKIAARIRGQIAEGLLDNTPVTGGYVTVSIDYYFEMGSYDVEGEAVACGCFVESMGDYMTPHEVELSGYEARIESLDIRDSAGESIGEDEITGIINRLNNEYFNNLKAA